MTVPGSAHPLLMASLAEPEAYTISRSLRFNDGDGPSLLRTPSSAGNLKTWTLSFWMKRTSFPTDGTQNGYIFNSSNTGNNNHSMMRFQGQDVHQLHLYLYEFTAEYGGWDVKTARKYKDPSAWYHIVVAMDTTQATAADRLKIFTNGVRETEFASASYPAQNQNAGQWNSGFAHRIGKPTYGGGTFDGYLADIHFVDGQQLAASDFGEYNDNGIWVPKRFTGTYTDTFSTEMTSISSGNIFPANGTNTLNALDGSTSTALDCRRGTHASTTSIRFTPSPAITGVTKIRVWAPFANKYQINGGGYQTFTGTSGWSEIYNGSSISLTTLDVIRDSGNAGSDYGHQLHAIEINDVILTRDGSSNSFHLDFSDNSSNAALGYDAAGSNNWTPSNLIAVTENYPQGSASIPGGSPSEGTAYDNLWDGAVSSYPGDFLTAADGKIIQIDWSAGISGVTKIRYYSYNGNDRHNVNSGGWSTNSGSGQGWKTAYSGSAITLTRLELQKADGASYVKIGAIEINDQIVPFFRGGDSVLDSPTDYDSGSGNPSGNYPTLNPVARLHSTNGGVAGTGNYSDGNLTTTGQGQWSMGMSTIAIPGSGKWYCEMQGDGNSNVGIASYVRILDQTIRDSATSNAAWYAFDGKIWSRYSGQGSTTTVTTGLETWQNGKTLGIAVDADSGVVKFYVNGSLQYSYTLPSQIASVLYDGKMHFMTDTYYSSHSVTVNFGQQGFTFTPPANHLPLCTANLPTPTIEDPSTAMDMALYTGNGTTGQSITGLNMSPDMLWIKERSSTGWNLIFDTVRGAPKAVGTNSSNAQYNITETLTSFDSNGFSVDYDGVSTSIVVNRPSQTYAAWAWDAGNTTTTVSQNANGTNLPGATCDVRANTTTGFSIVKVDSPQSNEARVHGLGVAPDVFFCKSTASSDSWHTYWKVLGRTKYINLNGSDSAFTSDQFGSQEPDSTYFYVKSNTASGANKSGGMVYFLWSAVEGYSSIGEYVGNGNSTDGVFVSTSFRPKWIMVKRHNAGDNWAIYDAERLGYNIDNNYLYANSTTSELTSDHVDIVSNGFKWRTADGMVNSSGGLYLYMCFAEHPFKYAKAR